MAVQPRLYTLAEFVALVTQPEYAERDFELIDGEIVEMSPSRTSISRIGHLLVVPVYAFCRAAGIPCYTSGEAGAYSIGTSVVAPDFAYKPTPMSDEYPDPVPPLWAVEIVSPTDKVGDNANKRAIYVNAKLLYWEVYTDSKRVHVYEPDKPLRVLEEADTLDGGAVLPGFTLPVRDLFAA